MNNQHLSTPIAHFQELAGACLLATTTLLVTCTPAIEEPEPSATGSTAASAGNGGVAGTLAVGKETAGSGGVAGTAAAGMPTAPSGGTAGASAGNAGAAGLGMAGTTLAPGGGSAGAPAISGCAWDVADGRVVLFDGTNLDQWQSVADAGPAPWQLDAAEMSVEVTPFSGNIQTKLAFEDLCLHLEYMTPMYPLSVVGQDRGNSGIYFKRAYEMQILDSVGQPPANNTCGAVYSIQAPLTVACNKELVWNTYEIQFKASQWTGTNKTKNASIVSATLNGKPVQQNVDLNPAGNLTQGGQPDAAGPQPLMLQDHHNNVRFRNIWTRVPK